MIPLWFAAVGVVFGGAPDDFVGACQEAFAAQRFADAEKACTSAVRRDPHQKAAWKALIGALVKQQKFGEAQERLQAATEAGQKDAFLLVLLGEARLAAGEPAGAKKALLDAIRLQDEPDARNGLVRACEQLRDFECAVNSLRALERQLPEDPSIHEELARVEHERGHEDARIGELRKAARLSPKDAAAWERFGNALLEHDLNAEAMDAYSVCLGIDKRNTTCLVNYDIASRSRALKDPHLTVQPL
jgi:tetratricopeptide (TPR) repeat protein